jgi:ribose transport system permease protein
MRSGLEEKSTVINKISTKGKMSNESFITLSMFVVLIVMIGLASIFVKNFFQIQNIINLVTNFWYLIVLGIGATYLLITGNFELSIGGTVAMTGVLSVYFCQAANVSQSELANGLGLPYGVAVALALLAALAIGAINALFVTKLKVASIVVTLGTMSLSRGIAKIVTLGAQRNTNLPDVFGAVGNIFVIGSLKLMIFIMLFIVIVAVVLEKKTVFGRRTYLIGANIKAAKLSGVKVEQHITILYLVSAFLAGVVGIILASEYISGTSSRVMGVEFDALVITLLGGTAIAGGFGSVLGTVIGALILAVVASSSTGLLLRPEWQFILKSLIVFTAIMAQRFALLKRKL